MSGGSSSLRRRPSASGAQRRGDVEVRDLAERVHARVGAARAVQLEPVGAERLAHGAVDLALHRPRVLLDLPAAVAGAGVLDEQLEPGHAGLRLAQGSGGTGRGQWSGSGVRGNDRGMPTQGPRIAAENENPRTPEPTRIHPV